MSEHPKESHNLAAYQYGPVLRTNSFFSRFSAEHHPVHLVDEYQNPVKREKWCSKPGDPAAWVEIIWGVPKHIERIKLQHGGAVEEQRTTLSSYRIRCISHVELGQSYGQTRFGGSALTVSDNTENRAEHPLDCMNAIGVRFDAKPNVGDDSVRLYELEVWGS